MNPNAQMVNITAINHDRAILSAETGLKKCQIGIVTDGEPICLSFRDHLGDFHEVTIEDSLAHNIENHLNYADDGCGNHTAFMIYNSDVGMWTNWAPYTVYPNSLDNPKSTKVDYFNADLLDNLHASDFSLSGHLHDDRYSLLGHTHVAAEITDLNTTVVSEGTNLYFTDARVQLFADTRYSLILSGDIATHYHTSDTSRDNHTGTQLASTISDFDGAVQAYCDPRYNQPLSIWGMLYTNDIPFYNVTTFDRSALSHVSTNVIKLGRQAAEATATPSKLQFDNSFSDGTTRDKCKIELYNDGLGAIWGFGVGSDSDLQLHASTAVTGRFDFYVDNAKCMSINSKGINLGTQNDPAGNQGDQWITWGGIRSDGAPYHAIRTNYKTYGSDTSNRLQIGWHTGIEIMSIGDGDNNVRLSDSLIAIGAVRSDYGCYAYNTADATGTYIGVFKGQGSLPGYPDNYFPVIKTDFTNIYFSCGNAYSGYMGYANDTSFLGLIDGVRSVYLTTNGSSYFNGGNVGIGITNPTYPLHVNGTAVATDTVGTNGCYAYNTADATGTYIGVFKGQGSLPGTSGTYPTLKTDYVNLFLSCNNQWMGYFGNVNSTSYFVLRDEVRGDNTYICTNGSSYFNGGNVGIGTTSPSEMLDVNGNAYVNGNACVKTVGGDGILFTGDNGVINRIQCKVGEYSSLYIESNNILELDSSEINISGTTTNIYSSLYMPNLAGISGGGYVLRVSGTGLVYRDTSSMRYKTNIKKLESSETDWIYGIEVKKYDRKDGSKINEYGIIAEEFEKVNKDLIIYDKDGNVDGWDKLDTVPVLIKVLQDHKKTIDKLKKEIDELKTIESKK
jgi:hypothetical protein